MSSGLVVSRLSLCLIRRLSLRRLFSFGHLPKDLLLKSDCGAVLPFLAKGYYCATCGVISWLLLAGSTTSSIVLYLAIDQPLYDNILGEVDIPGSLFPAVFFLLDSYWRLPVFHTTTTSTTALSFGLAAQFLVWFFSWWLLVFVAAVVVFLLLRQAGYPLHCIVQSVFDLQPLLLVPTSYDWQ